VRRRPPRLTWVVTAKFTRCCASGLQRDHPAMRDAPLLAKQLANDRLLTGGRPDCSASDSSEKARPSGVREPSARPPTALDRRGAYIGRGRSRYGENVEAAGQGALRREFTKHARFHVRSLPPQARMLHLGVGARRRILRARRSALQRPTTRAAERGADRRTDPKLRQFQRSRGAPMTTISGPRAAFAGTPEPIEKK